MSSTPTNSQPIRDTDLDRQFEQARRKLSQQRSTKATATATRHSAADAARREEPGPPGATPPRPPSAGDESLNTPAGDVRALSTAAQESQTPGAQSPTGQLPPKSRAARPLKTETPPPPPHQISRPAANHGRLWQDGTSNSQGKRNAHKAHSSSSTPASASRTPAPQISQHDPEVLIKQPETKPISQEQLIAEVKGIYAGLVMVENKCIEVDNAQNSGKEPPVKLNNEQWQALIALHRTLLHEHHDFFLASQHPSASPALTRLASKYAMPARMWRHGIHSFLELLRHRLPAAREHMLTFIYLAYSMMALLYETVPAFEETWIECLGDLGRYRMAIEDDNMSDREVWTSVSRHWYSKASDKSPSTGRLYHHLAILARPNVLQQLYYYTKALCVPTPFASARDSILTLFEPILNKTNPRIPSQDRDFVYMHAIIFKNIVDQHKSEMESAMESFIDGISIQIARNGRRWVDVGMHLANSNCAAMTGYGDVKNPIMAYIRPGKDPGKGGETPDVQMQDASVVSPSHEAAVELTTKTNRAVWSRLGDPSILAHLHVSLVFLYHLTFYPGSLSYVSKKMPWRMLCVQLDTLVPATENTARFESDEFPLPAKGEAPRPLVEDYAMRGLLWTEKYFPLNWFSNDQINDDDKWFEMPSFMDERRIRCLWLAIRIAKQSDFILYDPEAKHFAPGPDYDKTENEDSSPTTAETTSGAATPTTAPTAFDGPMEIDDEPSQKSVLPEILP